MAITKVSGHVIEPTTNITSHNINSSGIITATRFDGPLGVGLTDGNFSGIVTTAQLNVTGVSTFRDDVEFHGSSGITSMTWDKSISRLHFKDSADLSFGDGNDLIINHTGSHSTIQEAGSGDLNILSDSLYLHNSTGTKKYLRALTGAQVDLYYNDNIKITTTNTGAVVTGICTATDFSGAAGGAADFPNGLTGTTATFSGSVSIGGTLTYEDVTNIDSVGIVTARAGIIDSTLTAGRVVYADTDKSLTDNAKLTFDGSQLFVTRNLSTSANDSTTGSEFRAGMFYFRSRGASAGISGQTYANQLISSNGSNVALEIYTQGSATGCPIVFGTNTIEKLRITPNGDVYFSGDQTGNNRGIIYNHANGFGFYASANSSTNRDILFYSSNTTGSEKVRITTGGSIKLPDNAKIELGGAQTGTGDLRIYHDTNNSRIENNTGQLKIRALNSGASVQLIDHNDTAMLQAVAGGVVSIAHNNSVKFATSTEGITVTGEVAASQDYPKYRPTLDFNFAAVKKLDSRFTFSRTGPASYVDEDGYVQMVSANVPRFDHDPVTKECKGLLTEQSCANWIKQSTNLSESGWGTNNVTHTLASDVVAPDGTTGSVYESKENNSNSYHASHYSGSIPVTSGQYYTVSSWVKKGPNYRTDINSGKYQFYCTRGTGTVASLSINSDFDTITDHNNTTTRSITQYRNGWVRVTYSFTSNASVSSVTPHWLLGNGGSYSGNGASSVYIWGCQFEQMRFPTSYVPTNGSVVFRGTDDVTLDGTEFTDVFNPDEGTSVVYAHMPNENGAAGLPAYTFKNTSNSNITLGLSRDNNASPAYHYYNDGSNSGFSRSSATGDNMYKGAMSFKTSDFDSYVNGSANTNTTTFTMPTIDNLRIGGIGGANQAGGHVARFMYYPVKLTNNQLATLTS